MPAVKSDRSVKYDGGYQDSQRLIAPYILLEIQVCNPHETSVTIRSRFLADMDGLNRKKPALIECKI
ncbi:MAG: hypothetical protein V3V31_15500 [Methylococcales bacterium]